MIIPMNLGEHSYEIVLERGALGRAKELLALDRRVMLVTDDGVPAQYAKTVASQCKAPQIHTVPQGENSKSFEALRGILSAMLAAGFTRGDCVVAVGGGVVGDLAGFAAASYMRGIDFYNIPTTVLSQADSSIGGKCAINLDGVKNCVGAFYQPSKVLIDPQTADTLEDGQRACGLAEIIKAGLIADAALFAMFEAGDATEHLTEVIEKALLVKKHVVEEDEKESGLRKILNFGHTIGHGIESVTGLPHGACVAAGMLPMCAPDVRERLLPVLRALGLPTEVHADRDAVFEAMTHDKKMGNGTLTAVFVEHVGQCELRTVSPADLRPRMEMVVKP